MEDKVIKEFRKYVELIYLDIINEETISIYSELYDLNEEEKRKLERRFLK